jgi:hypothetical protein
MPSTTSASDSSSSSEDKEESEFPKEESESESKDEKVKGFSAVEPDFKYIAQRDEVIEIYAAGEDEDDEKPSDLTKTKSDQVLFLMAPAPGPSTNTQRHTSAADFNEVDLEGLKHKEPVGTSGLQPGMPEPKRPRHRIQSRSRSSSVLSHGGIFVKGEDGITEEL